METAASSTVVERYRALVKNAEIEEDSSQLELASALDGILEEVGHKRLSRKSSSLGWLFAGRAKKKTEAIRGLYIHGSVGRGKTMLMDLFYQLVPARNKRRVHFHAFMADVHDRINAHRRAHKRGENSQSDPIPPVAEQLIAEAWVLCFDEFSVTDIADAMVLSRLFEQLFNLGCVLVATSNVEPDDLYRDGLNRQLFMPFIALLKSRVDVFNLDARTDYRLEKLRRQPVYLTPLTDANRIEFAKAWREVTAGDRVAQDTLTVMGRTIRVPMAANGVARFSFDELCRQPLGTRDYLAIVRHYHTLFIENVPVLDPSMRNEAKRFINLVDTLYDSGARVFITAAAKPEALFVEGRGTEGFEFARTASRLFEMQSLDYLSSSRAADVA
jgi:cell division protein ZapE